MADATHAVAMAAHRLRPEAVGAARLAAAPGVERHIRVLQIADEVILDLEVALVDLADEGQLVHVLEDGALGIVHDGAGIIAIAEAVDAVEAAPLGDFLDGEVELVAADEIERRRSLL